MIMDMINDKPISEYINQVSVKDILHCNSDGNNMQVSVILTAEIKEQY